LEIILAKHAGLCFGVKRALDLTVDAAKKAAENKERIYSLGPVIHNPQAVAQLEEMGVMVADTLDEVESGQLVVRSHGVPASVREDALERSLKLVDATCPFVRRSIRWASNLQKNGYQVVVVGEVGHPEIQAVLGSLDGQGWVIASPKEAQDLSRCPRMGVVAQTTQSFDNYQACVVALMEKAEEIRVYNTICPATAQRQAAAYELAQKVDVMLVIGGHNSANTSRLAQMCGKGGARTYHIETEAELKKEWFNSVATVGITAGASTPTWLIEGVIRRMKEFSEERQTVEQTDALNPEETEETAPEENSAVEEEAVPEQEEGAPEAAASESDMNMKEKYAETFVTITPGQMVTGHVVQVGDDEVLVDIGYKSEGVIPYRELGLRSGQSIEDVVQRGDEIQVVVTKVEDEGNVQLSKRRADTMKTWETLEEAHQTGEVIEARVRERVKGGLLVDVGVRGFVPASHVARNYVENLDEYVGQNLRLKVIELDRDRNNVVLSRKEVLEEEYQEAKARIFAELQEGQIVTGIVRRITDFGAFVDIGSGVEGLLHVSEMAWSRVRHPSDIVSEDDEIRIMVLNVDRESERISLGLKQTLPDPWDDIDERYRVGEIVEGQVTRVVDFGAFVKLEDGVEGLVHISQMADHHVNDPREVVQEGEEVQVKILSIDGAAHRIGLSIREVPKTSPEPAEETSPRYSPGDADTVTIGDMIGDDLADLFDQEEDD
jgi:small subunit ribosomal protein S1